RAEPGLFFDAEENVGTAEPHATPKRPLRDNSYACLHVRKSLRDNLVFVLEFAETNNFEFLNVSELFQIGLFVRKAALLNDHEVRRSTFRFIAHSVGEFKIERRKMRAGEVVAEISSGQAQGRGSVGLRDALHGP